jgi:hypothetical protein
MHRTEMTTRREHTLGTFAMFLLGAIGAAFELYDRLRHLVEARSRTAEPVAVDRCEIS